MMNLREVSATLTEAGVAHEYVEARTKPLIRNVRVKFKTATERTRLRKQRKKWELRNKSKLKIQHKRYEMKMRNRKPNPILSKRAKQVAKKYQHNSN